MKTPKSCPLPARRASLASVALFATLLASGSAYAADVTYTASTTGTDVPTDWTAVTWSTPDLDWTATAGDLAQFNGNGSYTINTDVTIGSIKLRSTSGDWNILSDGTHTLTLDGTGISGANQTFGNAGVASIVNANNTASAGSNRHVNLGNATTGLAINMASDLDIGVNSNAGQGVIAYGTLNNTSGAAKTLTLLANSTQGTHPDSNAGVTLNSSVGTSGSAIAIVNAGTGKGNIKLAGALGSEVTGITQNSATSEMFISGDNSAFVGNTSVTVGKLSIGSNYTFASGTDNHLSLTGAAAPVAGTDFGQILVTAGTTTFGGDLTLDFTGTAVDGAVYDLFSASGSGALGGGFSSVSIAGTYAASLTNNSGVWTGSSNGFDFSFSEATGDLTIAAAIPEPATCAFLAGLVTLGFIAARRRRA